MEIAAAAEMENFCNPHLAFVIPRKQFLKGPFVTHEHLETKGIGGRAQFPIRGRPCSLIVPSCRSDVNLE